MEAEKRKILEGIHDLLKSMPQDCLGTGEGAAGWIWPIRDEVMDNLCKVMAEPAWTRIDPEDEATWPVFDTELWVNTRKDGVKPGELVPSNARPIAPRESMWLLEGLGYWGFDMVTDWMPRQARPKPPAEEPASNPDPTGRSGDMPSRAPKAQDLTSHSGQMPDKPPGEVDQARRWLEELLSPWFDVPFSDDNVTAKEIAKGLARLRWLQRSRKTSDYQALSEALTRRLDALAQGKEGMVITGGDALWAKHEGQVIVSTESRYRYVFDLRPSGKEEG